VRAGLELHLLGTPQIILDGRPLITLTSAKAQALLFYLAVTRRAHTRAALASLLWGNVPDAAARANLRKAMQQLREHLAPWLAIRHDSLALAPDARCWVDVIEVDAALRDAGEGDTDRLLYAVDLYAGDFLHAFYVRDAPDFEEWWLREQARLREQVLDGLNRLAEHHAARGQLDEAIGFARRFLVLEPWREQVHRRLMLWLALDGQRGAALAQYEICRQTLAGELDVEPAAETTALYQRIRDGDLVFPAPAPQFPSVAPQRPAFLDEEGRTGDATVTRLVGRERQFARLAGILDLARSGQGQVAFVSAEAGWGKTSLLVEFSRLAQERDPALIVASGICTTPTGAGDPYLPFREILQMLAADVDQKWTAGTISRRHALVLWRFLPQVIEALITRGRHLIGSLLPGETLLQRAAAHESIDPGALQQVAARTVEARDQGCSGDQERIFEDVGNVLQSLAAQQPLLLILDDLHWADASSINLLFHLGRRMTGSRILILGAYRPEETALDRVGSKHPLADALNEFRRTFGDVWVHLDQVQPEEARAFVDALIDIRPNRLGDDFRSALSRHAGGHPLFTIETLRDMRERGDLTLDDTGQWVAGANLEWNSLPARVEGVIEMRVRRLDPHLHRVLAVASVEGETFTAQAVAHVCGVDERELVRVLDRDGDALHRLVQEQGIKRVGQQRLSVYRFRHNLFQRYLYSQLSESERQFVHEDVGNALEHLYGDQKNRIAVELAYHFEAAGDAGKAIDHLIQAGKQAIQLSAHDEAIAHLTRGVELLSTLPPSPDRDRQELSLHISLGEAQRFEGHIPADL
jgi:DNA-binding SARP family transcriptional activator